jgi:hypothetical protein
MELYKVTLAAFLLMGLNILFGNGATLCGLPAESDGAKQFGIGLIAYAIAHHLVPMQDAPKRHGSLAFILFAFYMNGTFTNETKMAVLALAIFNFMGGDSSKAVTQVEGSAKQRAFFIFFNFAWACQFVIYFMKPSDWPYYNADDKSVYLLSILFLTWVSENTSNPPTSTAAGLKTFFYVILLSNIAAIIFIHGMSWAAWKETNDEVWIMYGVTAAFAYYASM